ncbi:MAG TPA: guanylate kinase [Thermodesulfovibrionales bacterium]|nr:guanylate kinase [Thermodesulfovibrionales bacterium]
MQRRTMQGKARGSLFIVSAPSGAGKTTLCRKLTEVLPGIGYSISHTTRRPRAGEENGRDYIFVDEAEFRRMIGDKEFLEWATVHGNLYGTSQRMLREMQGQGTDVILDIDVQGARQLREASPEGVSIFILPPSLEVLRSRLEKRGSNSAEDMERRMRTAVEEIREYKKYDYVIVNDLFEKALDELRAVVLAERVKTDKIDPEWVKTFGS